MEPKYTQCTKCNSIYSEKHNSNIASVEIMNPSIFNCMCHRKDRLVLSLKEYKLAKLLHDKDY